MNKFALLYFVILLMSCSNSGHDEKQVTNDITVSNSYLNRVEPPNWWVGFKNETLQLLVHEPNIGEATVQIDYPGVYLEQVHKAQSSNYLFIDLSIQESTKPGKFDIEFNLKNGDIKRHTYELKDRVKRSEDFVGFNSSDAIYLITPDRFANAIPENDSFDNLKQTGIDRDHDYKRHGGDIAGITAHLDYISELGFTAIWSTPLLLNDMPEGSYHGYAITDLYQVDPRFGSNNDYVELSSSMQERGMKLIMDQVANHCGLEHWWMKDLPFDDWVNYQEHFENNIDKWSNEVTINSNHRRTTNQDIYASKIDADGMRNGWFVKDMPDLNQRNPYMAKYLIQNSIWWIETAELGGIRQDTYPYPDKEFMSAWAGAIMNEYPSFNIVGEEWSYNPLLIAYWQEGNNNLDGYKSNLKSTMDFAMQKQIVDALNENEQWDKGLIKIYEGLANDFAYADPKNILLFPDNHDMSRIYTQLGEDLVKTKMAIGTILTLPRTPQLYYGTEILMDDSANPGDHGLIRTDFPGGWNGDRVNTFTGIGLNEDQKDMQSFIKKVLNYRKNSEAIHLGETVHFAPEQGTYFLTRQLKDEVIVIILNKNEEMKTMSLDRFEELELTGRTMKNIVTDELVTWEDDITLKERGITLLTTKTQ